jgi:hypothetical protein
MRDMVEYCLAARELNGRVRAMGLQNRRALPGTAESVPETEGASMPPAEGRSADIETDWRNPGSTEVDALVCASALDDACVGAAPFFGVDATLDSRAKPWNGDFRTADMVGHNSVVIEAAFCRATGVWKAMMTAVAAAAAA